jgi:hypothetical protein
VAADRAIRTLREVIGVKDEDEIFVKLLASGGRTRIEVQEIPQFMVASWKEAGFDSESAQFWNAVGCNPILAKQLLDAGLTPIEIRDLAERGWRPDVLGHIVAAGGLGALRERQLDPLLQRWLPASIGYMFEQGFSVEDTKKWILSGINSPAVVKETMEAGGTAEIAQQLIETGIAADAVPIVVEAHLPKDVARQWGSLRLDRQTLASMLKEQASPDDVREIVAAGATPEQLRELPLRRISKDEAVAWLDARLRYSPSKYIDVGVEDPSIARQWEEKGFLPDLIAGFVTTETTPDEALQLVRLGLTDTDVGDGRRTPPLSRVSWNQVFRRSRADGEDFVLSLAADSSLDIARRFWYAVHCLTIEQSDQSGMYSNSISYYRFADGGITDITFVYGFGSRAGTWVLGTQALRLICGRMGVRQPRRLKCEESIPDLANLEMRLSEVREAYLAGTTDSPFFDGHSIR